MDTAGWDNAGWIMVAVTADAHLHAYQATTIREMMDLSGEFIRRRSIQLASPLQILSGHFENLPDLT